MQLGLIRSRGTRGVVLGIAVGAAFHFAISCSIWGRFVAIILRDPSPPWRRIALECGPAALLLLWFITAAVLAWRRRRASAILVIVGLLLAGILFAHDAATRNWQLHAESYRAGSNEKTFFYFTWWWYDQRWLGG